MDEETKPKRKAKDNPWYRLATFHGEPAAPDDEVAAKNRVTWNRWMAPRIPDDLRAALLEKGHTLKELEPLPEDKFQKIGSQLGISAEALIDFSDTEFEALFANGFVFPRAISFAGATFSGNARFDGATFGGFADFYSATFSGEAGRPQSSAEPRNPFALAPFRFDGATFSSHARFGSVTFSDNADFSGATFGGFANFYSASFSGEARFESELGCSIRGSKHPVT